MEDNKPKWQYRFDEYKRSYELLKEICDKMQKEEPEQIAKEGMIKRFEFCMEMAWKSMRDYMQHNDFVFSQILPSIVIRDANNAKLIDNPVVWLQAMDDRNKISNTYDLHKFDEVIKRISTSYLNDCFAALHDTLSRALSEKE